MKNSPKPPKYFQRFFEWFCHDDFWEELQGDLEETFYQNLETHGLSAANWSYRKEVIKLFRPSVIKSIRLPQLSSKDMLQNYIKIAFRNFAKHKLFSAINLLGLAIGMCLGLLVIGMFYDLSQFDEFHENKSQIYRLTSTAQVQNWSPRRLATSSMPLANQVELTIPGVKEVTRIRRFFAGDVTHDNHSISLRGHLVDNNFFSTFSFPMLEGDPSSALNQPYNLVLTQSAAKRLFGDQNPMGQLVEIGNYGTYTISGICADPPKFSHIQFEMLGSFSTISGLEKEERIHPSLENLDNYHSNYTYLLVSKDQDVAELEGSINQLAHQLYQAVPDIHMEVSLQALTDIVPGEDLNNQIGPNIPPVALVVLSVIAIVVLLSACFNYTNLSIARSLRRAREIGIRKVVGARRREIILQFLCESTLIAVIAVMLSIGLFQFIKPGFLSLLPKDDLFQLQLTPAIIGLFLGFAIISGILAGIFPALFLSTMKPVQVFKNIIQQQIFKKLTIRKALIVFQFVISTAFIIATAIIFQQYKFAINKDLGFSKDNILNVTLNEADLQRFKTTFSKLPEVKQISFTSQIPGTNSSSQTWVKLEEVKDSLITHFFSVDENFLNNLELKLIAGQQFTEESAKGEYEQLIVNRQFLEPTNWNSPSEAIGQWVIIEGTPNQIVGVVEDFHYTHLEEPINSFCLRYQPDQCQIANLKIASHDIPTTMKKLTASWKLIGASSVFEAKFLDQQIEETYQFLINIMSIFGFIAFLAITIACLGLLGMAIYTTETKLKEISIRKIFGASRSQLVLQLSKAFIYLLLIASCIAIPITYFLFDEIVLNNFAFRIEIGILELSSGFLLILFLGLLTLGSQTWKAASSNPAEYLKSE